MMLKDNIFKCILDIGLNQPVTLNMLSLGDSNNSQSENFALFNLKHTYILQTKIFH